MMFSVAVSKKEILSSRINRCVIVEELMRRTYQKCEYQNCITIIQNI